MAIILIVIKASLLLGAALAGARLLRRAPAATRHALWSVTFAALLALPWIGSAMPAVPVPVPRWMAGAGCPQLVPGLVLFCVPQVSGTVDAAAVPRMEDVPAPTGMAPIAASSDAALGRHEHAAAGAASSTLPIAANLSIAAVARGIWLAGALAAAGALLLSLLRVHRLTRTASDVTDPAWRAAAETIGARLAIRRPARVLVSDAVRTPMAGGVWRPLIFLPAEAASWSDDRRDVVLAHELSHIARRDPLRHVAARLAVACYWFHPLAWLAAKHSSLAREQACDEAVLALGVRPSDYARVLLDLADTMAPQRATALPMVERSLLETRLMAILDHGIRPSRQSVLPATAAAALALALAAAQPAARAIDVRSPALVTPPRSTAAPRMAARTAAVAVMPPAMSSGPQARGDASCPLKGSDRDGFSGYTDTDARGTILHQVGASGGALIIQQRFGDLRVCMAAEGQTGSHDDSPTAWAGRAPHVIIETTRGASTINLDVRRQSGAPQTTWRVNGAERPFDATAQAWRDAVLAVLDRTWEVSMLRGEASSLHGDISSVRGEESSLRGEISSVRGEVSAMRGEQSSVRGEESMLRGEISEIQGHLSALRGQISAERGSISMLEASRYGLSSAERDRLVAEIKAHDDEIARLEREVRDYDEASKIAAVEKQIRALNADGKVAAIEEQIRKFDEAGKVAAIEKQIEALHVEGKTAELERRIQALDVDGRSRQIESRLDEAVRRLEQALAAIR